MFSHKLFTNVFHVFRLDEDRVLVEQLQLLLRNYSTAALPLALLALLLLWALSSTGDVLILELWCATSILSTLNFYLLARRYLRDGIALEHARRLAWVCMSLRLVDGALWGSLVWVGFDTSTAAGIIFIFAAIASMAGGAVSTLSPVIIVFVAYTAPLLALMSIKMWLTGDSDYGAIGWAGVLYFFAMMSQALNTSNAARFTINLRFELTESNRLLHEIEIQQTLTTERKRLVQDMHDGLGSSLVSALRVVEKGRMDEAAVAEVLKGCIDDLKLAIDSMESVDADLLLLLATLRYRLGPRLESTGIKLIWEVEAIPAMNWLDPRNALHILRILQEAFTNIIKHTEATTIRVATCLDGNYALVDITDNGHGFNLDTALKNGGKGLSNQIRRAESIGACISWNSSEEGTCFSLRLPITQPTQNQKIKDL